VFLAEPPRTQFDLQFHVAGFPVRIHPLFWLLGVILGARSGDGATLLIWVGVLFISILIHELGHAFAMRYFGESARIVLYVMGGLAIPDSSPWDTGMGKRGRGTREQIIISAAGPGAGFALAGLVVAGVFGAGGSVELDLGSLLPPWIITLPPSASPQLGLLINGLLWVNIFWGIINLLPVYPLDGGQISREVLISLDSWNGAQRAAWLSVFAGAAAAILGIVVLRSLLMALLFGSLAFSNYQALQRMGGGRPW
jgi:Zn-dependent protease